MTWSLSIKEYNCLNGHSAMHCYVVACIVSIEVERYCVIETEIYCVIVVTFSVIFTVTFSVLL